MSLFGKKIILVLYSSTRYFNIAHVHCKGPQFWNRKEFVIKTFGLARARPAFLTNNDMSQSVYVFFNSDSRSSWVYKCGEDVVKIFVIDGLCRDCQIVAFGDA